MISQQQLTECDKEPIHIPGLIQPIGFMLVVDIKTCKVSMQVGDTPCDFGTDSILKTWPDIQNVFSNLKENDITEGVVAYKDNRYSIRIDIKDNQSYIIEAMLYEKEWISESQLLEKLYSVFDTNRSTILYDELCRFVHEVTGFDRVMLYTFNDDGDGKVIGEVKKDNLDSYLYHQFPASDIPVQARALYVKSRARSIANVNHEPILLDKNYSALDLTNCYLRAVSPVHIEYLKNMNVESSMSISIVVNGELWGLIACHHMSERVISFENMRLLNLFSHICSREFYRLENESFYKKKDYLINGINNTFSNNNILESADAFKESLGKLCELFNSDNVLFRTTDLFISAKEIDKDAIECLNKYINGEEFVETNYFTTDCEVREKYEDIFSGAMGFKLDIDNSAQIWFIRKEVRKTIVWAGRPAKDITDGIISPRKSFESWEEIQRNRSLPWEKAEKYVAKNYLKMELLKIFNNIDSIDPKGLIENSNMSMLITDPNKKDNPIIDVNRAFVELYGYTHDEVLGKNPRILHGDIKDLVSSEKYREAISNKEPLSIMVQNQTKDGKNIWVMNNITPIFDHFGKIKYFIGSQYNISNLEKFEKGSIEFDSNDYMKKVLNTQDNILVVTDGKKIKYVNMSFLKFFGILSLEEFTKNHDCICEMFIPNELYFYISDPSRKSEWIDDIQKLPQGKRTVCMLSEKFETHAFTVHVTSFDNSHYIVTFTDISANIEKQLELFQVAMYDELTSSYNRRFFNQNMNKLIKDASKKSKEIGMLIADIDHFKKVNDTYGHDIGDEVLKSFVTILKEHLREDDWVVRWGGEEFIIITLIKSSQDLEMIANHLCEKIASTSIDIVGNVTASFGGTIMQKDEDIECTIKRIDDALYFSKHNGRNQVCMK